MTTINIDYKPTWDSQGNPLNHRGWKLNHSHSFAETMDRCERKAWYSYILRLGEEAKEATQYGIDCHKCLEDLVYLHQDWAGRSGFYHPGPAHRDCWASLYAQTGLGLWEACADD